MSTFTSCMTVDRIHRNCDKFAMICGTGTNTQIVYKDTTIFVTRDESIPIPADTAILNSIAKVDSMGAQMQKTESKQGIVTISTLIKNSKVTSTGYVNTSELIAHITDSIVLKNAVRATTSNTKIIVREKYIPSFYKFTFWFFFLIMLATGLIIIYKIIKPSWLR